MAVTTYNDNYLTNETDERDAAAEIRRRRMADFYGRQEEEQDEKTFRQKIAHSRMMKAAAKKFKKETGLPASLASRRALQSAWFSLIPSFGLSLIWINIHVFMRWVVGEEYFCKLGHEWVPITAKLAAKESSDFLGDGIGIFETIIVIILDVVVLFVALIIFFMIYILLQLFTMSLGDILKSLWTGMDLFFS